MAAIAITDDDKSAQDLHFWLKSLEKLILTKNPDNFIAFEGRKSLKDLKFAF